MTNKMQKWNPSHWRFGNELTSLQNEMDRFFEDLSTQFPSFSTPKNVSNKAADRGSQISRSLTH